MKFFHLSDLHIGKQLHHYNLNEDQKIILSEIIGYIKEYRPDAVFLAGDIYDKSVPSAEAVAVFDDFLTQIADIEPAVPVLIISGNHDNAQRLQYAAEILKKNQIYVAGYAPCRKEEHIQKVVFRDEYGEIDVYMLPFLKPGYVKEIFDGDIPDSYEAAVSGLIEREEIDFVSKRNILISHQFYIGRTAPDTCDSETISVGGMDHINVEVVKPFDYVALGHLHGRQKVGEDYIRYCGTPLKYSVSEAEHRKCLTMVTMREKGEKPEITELALHPLRDVKRKKGKMSEILSSAKPEEQDDYVSITLTDEVENYDPREQLQGIYSHILEIKIDNTRTRNKLEDFEDEVVFKDPMEAFENFYREIQGVDLGSEEEKIMKSIFEKVKGE